MICETQNSNMASSGYQVALLSERPRVLVAEDQDDVLAALGLLLKSNGYDAEFVKSPTEAIRMLAHRKFDAIILDLNYSRATTSGAEGLELLSKVQELDKTLAIVVMTAWATVEIAVDAMHRGACEFVQKPWDNAHLLKVLSEQMSRSRVLRQKRLDEELEQQEAAQIQRALMPAEIATPEGLKISASSQSARTVGGDYYDVIPIAENKLGICIADVMGKGVGAALLMSNLQAAVRTLAPQIAEPGELCNRVNQVISANSVPGKFITFFYCVVDLEQKRVTYTNAGHNWPILARATGSCERLSTDDVVLGTLRHWHYHQHELQLRDGDRLVLFTDGITECASADGAEFGEEKLLGLVAQNVESSADELKDLILNSAREHCSGVVTDDATLIVAAVR